MRYQNFIWPAAVLGVALVAGCDRANNDTLGDKVDRTGDQISREAAEIRQDTARATDSMDRKLDNTMDSVGRKTDAMQESAARAGDKLDSKLSDAGITVKAKSALIADPDLSGLQINVDTSNGVVTLQGDAKSSAAIERASSVVRAIEGVVSIDNQLRVDPAG